MLSDDEKERQTRELEDRIENTLAELNQDMRDKMRVSEPKDRLKLVCALIMAALGVEGKIPPLEIFDLKVCKPKMTTTELLFCEK